MSLISRAVSHETTSPRAGLAQLDPVGDVDHAVEHAEAGVADVVDRRLGADAEIRSDPASGGRLEQFAADTRVDHDVEVVGTHVRCASAWRAAAVAPSESAIARIPPPALGDAGERFELAFREVERVVQPLQARLPARAR